LPCEIVYNYWQFPDTRAIFTIDTEECRNYPNIPHQPSIERFDDFEYAEHNVARELARFRVQRNAIVHDVATRMARFVGDTVTVLQERYDQAVVR
jgi:hypothetical protein